MASGEAFGVYPTFNEQEVFETIGRPETIIKLAPSNFEGPVAHWANDRMRMFGETVVPKQVYIEQTPYKKPHRVAWVYHDGFNIDTGEPFCIHHIACDCSPEVDRVDSVEEKQEIMNECPALIPSLDRQAQLINSAYHISEVLTALSYEPGVSMYRQNPNVQNFVARSIVYMLERDYLHPQDWMANVESGWNLISLEARIFGLSSEDIEWLAQTLALEGILETDGTHLELSQQQKDNIEVHKRLNIIIDGVEKSTDLDD